MFGNTHMDSYHTTPWMFWKKAASFISGGKKATSSLVDPGSIITLNGKKVGKPASHDYSCEFPTGLGPSSYGFRLTLSRVVWNLGGSKIPPGYCSVPWQEVVNWYSFATPTELRSSSGFPARTSTFHTQVDPKASHSKWKCKQCSLVPRYFWKKAL